MKQQSTLIHMVIKAENVTLDFTKVQEFKASVVKKLVGGVEGLLKGNKVDIVRGEAFFVDSNSLNVMTETSSQTYNFKNAIIATGSRPIELPLLNILNVFLIQQVHLIYKKFLIKSLSLVAVYIGVELGTAYANFGTQVTILRRRR